MLEEIKYYFYSQYNKYIIKIQNGVLCDSDYREQKLLKLLRIVPILHLGRSTGGRIDVYDKTMTLRKAIQVVLNHMKEDGVDSSYHVAIAHTNDVPNAENIYHQIVDTFPGIDAEVISLCNVVSAQAGLGCLALEYFKKI